MVLIKQRKSLLEEQGYLCAYCMRRIREDKDVKIEHYHARNAQNELEYTNLLAVCTGNEILKDEKRMVNPDRFTGDTRKKNQKLHINFQSRSDMENIYYDNQGKIYSKNSDFEKDLNITLNLNDPYGFLISNRKGALDALKAKFKQLKPDQDIMLFLRKLESKTYQKNGRGELMEYTGILRGYITKQIRKHT